MFTARYGLSSYIKQTCFVFKRVNEQIKLADVEIRKSLQKFCGDRGGTVVKVLCYKSEGR